MDDQGALRQVRRLWWGLAATWALLALTVVLGSAGLHDFRTTWAGMQTSAAALEVELERTTAFADALEERIDAQVERASEELALRARSEVERAARERVGSLASAGERALARNAELAKSLEQSAQEAQARLEQGLARQADKLTHLIDHKIVDTTLRVETGSLALRGQRLRQGDDERSERGRVEFGTPYHAKPRVTLGLRMLDLPRSDRPRVEVTVLETDEKGFDYEIRTWGRSTVWDVTADWVAFGATGKDALAPGLPDALAAPHPR